MMVNSDYSLALQHTGSSAQLSYSVFKGLVRIVERSVDLPSGGQKVFRALKSIDKDENTTTYSI